MHFVFTRNLYKAQFRRGGGNWAFSCLVLFCTFLPTIKPNQSIQMEKHIKALEEFHARVQSRQYRTTVVPTSFVTQLTGKKDDEEKEKVRGHEPDRGKAS